MTRVIVLLLIVMGFAIEASAQYQKPMTPAEVEAVLSKKDRDNAAAEIYRSRMILPGYDACMWRDEVCAPIGPNGAMVPTGPIDPRGYYGGYGHFDREAFYGRMHYEEWRRNFSGRAILGRMRTNGDVKNVELYIFHQKTNCYEYLGSAKEFDSWYNQKLTMYAGRMIPLAAVRTTDYSSYTRSVRIPSASDMVVGQQSHTTFTIDQRHFETGRMLNPDALGICSGN